MSNLDLPLIDHNEDQHDRIKMQNFENLIKKSKLPKNKIIKMAKDFKLKPEQIKALNIPRPKKQKKKTNLTLNQSKASIQSTTTSQNTS